MAQLAIETFGAFGPDVLLFFQELGMQEDDLGHRKPPGKSAHDHDAADFSDPEVRQLMPPVCWALALFDKFYFIHAKLTTHILLLLLCILL